MCELTASDVVGPVGLHCECASGGNEVLRTTGAPHANPRALVTVLGTLGIDPATTGILISDGLGKLVPTDNRDTINISSGASIDIVGTARSTLIGNVGHVGEGDVSHR
jgi:hypothetical protein